MVLVCHVTLKDHVIKALNNFMVESPLILFSPTNFSPVTSTNVGISSQNILTFSYNLFASLAYNFKAIPSASPLFIKKIFQDSKKVKRIRNNVSKYNLYL